MSDGYQTEGLNYASSQFHWMGDGTGKRLNVPGREYNRNGLSFGPCTSWRWDPRERFFDDIVDAYEKAYGIRGSTAKAILLLPRCAPQSVGQRAVLCHARVDALRGGRSSRLGPRTHRQE